MNEYKPARYNSFMVLSMCFGVLSFLSCSVIFFSVPAGGLAILFAILSKGNDQKFQPLPLAGLSTAIAAMFLSVCITVGFAYLFMTNDYYHAQLNDACQQMYNQTFDEMMTERYPGLYDSSAFERK